MPDDDSLPISRSMWEGRGPLDNDSNEPRYFRVSDPGTIRLLTLEHVAPGHPVDVTDEVAALRADLERRSNERHAAERQYQQRTDEVITAETERDALRAENKGLRDLVDGPPYPVAKCCGKWDIQNICDCALRAERVELAERANSEMNRATEMWKERNAMAADAKRMRPVVEAAIEWRVYYKNVPLGDAVDAYRAATSEQEASDA